MFSTSTNEILLGLSHIPNHFLHQKTHPVQSCSGPAITVISNINTTQYQEELLLDSFNYGYIYFN